MRVLLALAASVAVPAAATISLYGGEKIDGIWAHYAVGSPESPASTLAPVIVAAKISDTDRSVDPEAWDHGAVYGSLHKLAGDAYGAAVTGYGRHAGGSGDIVGVHGRGAALVEESEVWGVWAHGQKRVPGSSAIGIEINIDNNTDDPSRTRGLVVATSGHSQTASVGVDVGAQKGSQGWLVGVRLRRNGVHPGGVQMRLEGSSSPSERYGGIQVGPGHLDYGIDFSKVDGITGDAAVILGENQRIVWGDDPSDATGISVSGETSDLVVEGLSLDLRAGTSEFRIGGTKVLDEQQPSLPPEATDLASALELINAMKERLEAHGLVATP